MSARILLTGATGAVGLPLAADLLSRGYVECLHAIVRNPADASPWAASIKELNPAAEIAKLRIAVGDITRAELISDGQIAAGQLTDVIHCAAFTKFRDTENEWEVVNVRGTAEMLRWREANCPEARFIHFSTLCAAGKTVGPIPEAPLAKPPGFVNGYEKSKWEAEQLVQSAPGPVAILRLATAIGSEADGSLLRVGAFHHVLRWVYRGLLPLVPGDAQTKLDLIPTEYIVDGVRKLVETAPAATPAFFNFSRGSDAIPLGELIDVCAARFGQASDAWKRGQVDAPVMASIPAFEEFRRSVLASHDLLFTQVLESVDSFLPELFFPKQFATDSTEALFGGKLPLGDWKKLLERVLNFSLQSDFGRNP